MSDNKILLSIVIVNWNSWEYIDNCLKSIEEYSKGINLEIIVIDNNSTDGSVANLQRLHPDVRLIALTENLGFPKANNLGFKNATGRYLLALNPDTQIYEDTLWCSIDFLEKHKEYGCVGVKTLKPNGRIQLECAGRFLTVRGAIWEMLLLDKIFPKAKFFKPNAMTYWDHKSDRDVDRISGAYMMFPRKLYQKIGGFDERLPMFLEDNEFCFRLWKNGYKIRYLADVEITHFVGQSTKKAMPAWVVALRYESYYLTIKELHGNAHANIYVILLLIVLPLKLIASPFLSLGIYIKNGYHSFSRLYYEALYGLLWCLKKMVTMLMSVESKERKR